MPERKVADVEKPLGFGGSGGVRGDAELLGRAPDQSLVTGVLGGDHKQERLSIGRKPAEAAYESLLETSAER